MDTLPLKTSVKVGGRTWNLFDVLYETADGKFGFYIYAISAEHAEHILEEIKATAKVSGQVVGFEPAGPEGNI